MEAALRSLSDDVASEIGVRETDGHPEAVAAAARRFCEERGVSLPTDHESPLLRDPALREHVVSALTNGETYFFRGADQWDLLRRRLLPEAASQRSEDVPLRLWSAGCASGEEPYTLAMVLDELGLAGRAEVLGTDVSTHALAAAERAIYSRWSLRSPQAKSRLSWFEADGGRYRLDRRLADRVSFRELNLLDDGPYPHEGTADLVLCRNVLLHMTREAAIVVAQRLVDALAPGGWLLLSAGDPALVGPGSLGIPGVAATLFESGSLGYRRGHAASGLPAPRGPIRDVRPWKPSVKQKAQGRECARSGAVDVREDAGSPAVAVAPTRPVDESLVEQQGRGAADRLGEARRALSEGRADAALTAATAAAFLQPDLAAAHLAAGIAAWRLDEPDVAARAFRRAAGLLAVLPAEDVVPLSDGEVAGRLRILAEDYVALVERRAGRS